MIHIHLFRTPVWTREFYLLGKNRIALFEKCNICGKQRDYFVLETNKNPEWVMIIK